MSIIILLSELGYSVHVSGNKYS